MSAAASDCPVVDEDVLVEHFDQLYRRYAPLITAYVRRRVDRSEVDDVVAQVFVVRQPIVSGSTASRGGPLPTTAVRDSDGFA